MTEEQRQSDLIAALLRDETTMTLATVDENGEPCIAPLYYIVDEDLTLYWLSSAKSQHSQNLRRSTSASAAVFQHTEYWKEICGVQIRGRVEIIDDPAIRKPLVKAYCERFHLAGVLRLAIHRSTLCALRPQWFRYVDNSIRFGYKFELTR